MVTWLAKYFVKSKDDSIIRQEYGILCSCVGIFLNLCLFAGKFIAGTISNSIAIVADAFNNLSDAGSSVITLVGLKLAGQKPDTEHPFGHGRIEYISGLAVSVIILLMAYELIRDSISKIIHPEETTCSVLIVIILVVSVFVKAYMAFYNRKIGSKINSAAMMATSIDSMGDTVATSVVFVSTIVGYYTDLHIDGYCGVLVGLFILYAGIGAMKETIGPLLGQRPDKEFVRKIYDIVLSHDEVCGIHDLIVHDYGPGRKMISLHAEVAADSEIIEIHDVIDNIEHDLRRKLGCVATIHMDPIVTKDEKVNKVKSEVMAIVRLIDKNLSIHDFRMVVGATHTNLIFDTVVPCKFRMTDEELKNEISIGVKALLGENYYIVIEIDRAYL